jgi:hypothetical protein
MRTLVLKGSGGREGKDLNLMETLDEFYINEYRPTTNHIKTSAIGMDQVFKYMATQIHTAYANNIQQHFIQHIRRFINKTTNHITTNKSILNQFKNQILQLSETNTLFNEWINEHYEHICPSNIEKSISYDLTKQPFNYLKSMLYMNTILEKLNYKLFQPLPLRTNIIPKHFTLDTTSIIRLLYSKKKNDDGLRILMTEKDKKRFKEEKEKKEKNERENNPDKPIKEKKPKALEDENPFFTLSELTSHVELYKFRVWGSMIKLKHKIFRKRKIYTFTGQIQTDGISCSVLFIRKGMKDKKSKSNQTKSDEQEYYSIEDLSIQQLQQLKSKTIIGCDPGKHSMVYMIDENRNAIQYTTAQRNYENKSKYNKKILELEKKKENNKINNFEKELSNRNSKTMNYELFKEYLRAKTILNDQTMPFYQKDVWRKMKFRQYSYGKKSIDKFLNKIESTFGKNLLIGYGNWSRSTQMKNSMPSMGKGLRRLIHKRFNTISINEYNTSKKCCDCHQNLKHYYDSNKKEEVYRLLVCSECASFENKKNVYRTRDANSAMNMLRLTYEWIHEQSRPSAFCRSNITSSFEPTIPVFTSEIPLTMVPKKAKLYQT